MHVAYVGFVCVCVCMRARASVRVCVAVHEQNDAFHLASFLNSQNCHNTRAFLTHSNGMQNVVAWFLCFICGFSTREATFKEPIAPTMVNIVRSRHVCGRLNSNFGLVCL